MTITMPAETVAPETAAEPVAPETAAEPVALALVAPDAAERNAVAHFAVVVARAVKTWTSPFRGSGYRGRHRRR